MDTLEKVTPGPWQMGVAGNANIVHFDGDNVIGVAFVGNRANAHLIAAAPDLLEALKLLSALLWQPATVGGYTIAQIANRVNAAIAKAEGRT